MSRVPYRSGASRCAPVQRRRRSITLPAALHLPSSPAQTPPAAKALPTTPPAANARTLFAHARTRAGARAHIIIDISRGDRRLHGGDDKLAAAAAAAAAAASGRCLCNSPRIQQKRKLRQNARLFQPSPIGHTIRTRYTDTRVSGP